MVRAVDQPLWHSYTGRRFVFGRCVGGMIGANCGEELHQDRSFPTRLVRIENPCGQVRTWVDEESHLRTKKRGKPGKD